MPHSVAPSHIAKCFILSVLKNMENIALRDQQTQAVNHEQTTSSVLGCGFTISPEPPSKNSATFLLSILQSVWAKTCPYPSISPHCHHFQDCNIPALNAHSCNSSPASTFSQIGPMIILHTLETRMTPFSLPPFPQFSLSNQLPISQLSISTPCRGLGEPQLPPTQISS